MKKEEVEKKLKPCPFCGGGAYIESLTHWSGGFKAVCNKGCIRTKKYYDREQATKAWNTRDLSQITIDAEKTAEVINNNTIGVSGSRIAQALKKANPIKIEEKK